MESTPLSIEKENKNRSSKGNRRTVKDKKPVKARKSMKSNKEELSTLVSNERCIRLKHPKNLSSETIIEQMKDENIINIFDNICEKKENDIYNEWRERLIITLFNMASEDIRLMNPKWDYYYKKMNLLKNIIHNHEKINQKDIVEERFIHMAGMKYNFDFFYEVTLINGEKVKYKYEYKNHDSTKIPQILSLFDTINPTTGEKNAKGQFLTKYTCFKEKPVSEENFEFWKEHPFWLYHFHNEEHGIPHIRNKLKNISIELPEITEQDYYCHVKKLAVPGCSSEFEKTLTKEEIEEKIKTISADSTLITKYKNHIKHYNEWGRNKNSPNVIRFFQILYENSKNIPEITSPNSIESYLRDFLEQNKTNVKRIMEEVSKRQTGKRFIFFDKHKKLLNLL